MKLEVEEYIYLTQLITPENIMTREEYRRIVMGYQWFGQYHFFMTDKKVQFCLKRIIFDSIKFTSITCETETNKPSVTQRNVESSMVIKMRKKNTDTVSMNLKIDISEFKLPYKNRTRRKSILK